MLRSLLLFLLLTLSFSLLTRSKFLKQTLALSPLLNSSLSSVPVSTTCSSIDLTGPYNYSGIVRSGYLTV